MLLNVHQLMHQREPEVVEAVVPQGERDDREPVVEHGGSVEVSLLVMRFDHQGDAMVGQELLC